MDIAKAAPLGPIQGTEVVKDNRNSGGITSGGPRFDELLQGKLDRPQGSSSLVGESPSARALGGVGQTAPLKFSQHAIERMRSRGISLNPEDMQRLQQAVGKAEAKGSKETLVLMKDAAMIVNIKNKTVVTAMDQQMMKENVFTNIDSTVIL